MKSRILFKTTIHRQESDKEEQKGKDNQDPPQQEHEEEQPELSNIGPAPQDTGRIIFSALMQHC